jgi:hypothetical protein
LVATIKEKRTKVTTKIVEVQYTIHNNNNNSKGKIPTRKKAVFVYQLIHSPGSEDDGLTKKNEKEITTIMQKKTVLEKCCFGLKKENVGNSAGTEFVFLFCQFNHLTVLEEWENLLDCQVLVH